MLKRLYIICIACSLLCCSALKAQPWQQNITPYKCVHTEKNSLLFPSGMQQMQQFYKLLDSLLLFDGRSINIVHIGGSHVQADVLTNTLRRDFTDLNYGITASRGVLFPTAIGKTNGSINVRLRPIGTWDGFTSIVKKNIPDAPLGITGMMALAKHDSTGLTVVLNRDSSQLFMMNKLVILGTASSNDVKAYCINNNDTILARQINDQNAYQLRFTAPVDSAAIFFKIPQGEEFQLRGVLPQMNRKAIEVHSLGVNGAALPSWLRCTEFTNELKFIKPDLVILAVGVNDANVPIADFNPEIYQQRYRELMARFREVSPNCAFIFITNNDCYKRIPKQKRSTNYNTPRVQQAMLELAKEYNAAVWDLFEVMGGLSSSNAWVQQGLMNSDHVHFSAEGYKLTGHLLFNAILESYSNYDE